MNPKKLIWFILPLLLGGLVACEKPTIEAELTYAPNVPAPIDRGHRSVVNACASNAVAVLPASPKMLLQSHSCCSIASSLRSFWLVRIDSASRGLYDVSQSSLYGRSMQKSFADINAAMTAGSSNCWRNCQPSASPVNSYVMLNMQVRARRVSCSRSLAPGPRHACQQLTTGSMPSSVCGIPRFR